MWSIQWKDGEQHAVTSLDHLNTILDDLWAAHGEHNPILVQLKSQAGDLMMIGVAGERAVLDYAPASRWPSQHSVGNIDCDGTIPFMMGIHESQMPESYAIPVSV